MPLKKNNKNWIEPVCKSKCEVCKILIYDLYILIDLI